MLRTEPASSNIAGRRPSRTLGRLSLAVAISLFASLAAPFVGESPVFATPLEEKRAEATHIAAQIEANATRIQILDEQYNGAVLRVADLTRRITDAQQQLAVAKDRAAELRTEVRARAAAIYMSARSGTLFPELDARDAQEVASRSTYAAAAAARDSTLLSDLRTATEQFSERQRDLKDALGRAVQEGTRLANTRIEIAQSNERGRQLLNEVNGEIGELVRQEQEARRLAAEAAARAEFARRAALERQREQQQNRRADERVEGRRCQAGKRLIR
jgi:septal ring factor EnvC (AmiA/AmiB activator)